MKNLTLMISICSLLSNLNVFSMHPNSDNFEEIFNKRNSINLASLNNVWTKDHTDLCQRIYCARSVSDYEAIKETIQNCHLNVDAHDIFGSTLLHQAATKKDTRVLEALLSKNPQNINAPNLFGLTALSCFLYSFYTYDDCDTKSKFLTNSFPTKSSPIKKIVPTAPYIYMPKLRRRRSVDSFGVMDCSDFNSKKIRKSTLINPIPSRMPNGSAKIIVEKFLALGADVRAKDKFIGLTALHYVTLAGDIDALLVLINSNPSAINELTLDGISPLDIAVDMKNIPIVTLLTKRGAKIRFENLQRALNNAELLQALLPYRNSLFNIENGTKILANYPFDRFDEDIISFLIDKGADMDISTNKSVSFLDVAVSVKNTPLVTLLAKRGAKVKFENLQKSLDNPALIKALLPHEDSLLNIKDGTKILTNYSFNCFNEEVISFLIDKGADVDSENKDQPSFLYKFAQHYSGNNNELIYKVIKASKHINAQYCWGHTALSVAVLWKNFNTAKKLLEVGADPHIRDKIGFSAIDLAKLYDLDLLEDYCSLKRRKIVNKFFI